MIVLGLHGGVALGQHDPAAALAINGRIVAACEEERYLRIQSAVGQRPYSAIEACLKIANIRFEDVDLVVTPGITSESFEKRIRDHLRHDFGFCPRVERVHHQLAHLAAAFYGSGLTESLLLSLDGAGDGACGMLAHATIEDGIRILQELPAERSLGFFYALMTCYLGFRDGDEQKLMELAPSGEPTVDLSRVIRAAPDGWELDSSFVRSEPAPETPCLPSYAARLAEVLGRPNRRPDGTVNDFYRDVARSTQAVAEDSLLSLVGHLRSLAPGTRNLCYAGGCALNHSANRRLLYGGLFDNIHVSPVASDRGLAVGCAYLGAVTLGDSPWPMWDVYLGSCYSDAEIRRELTTNGCRFEETDDPTAVAAELIADDKIVGWFQGRSEAGGRGLGNRSILADCRSAAVRHRLNARVMRREEFRTYAPSILQDRAADWFATRDHGDFRFMTFALDAVPERAPEIAAVVHLDGTAPVQTVRSTDNELYYELIRSYAKQTGVPVLLNASFRLDGQPLVETPRDALMAFYGSGLDTLVMGAFVVRK